MIADRMSPRDRIGPPEEAPLSWRYVLGLGLLLWLVAVALLVFTESIVLLPTVILLGSFLVPVAAVVFYAEHDVSPALRPRTVVDAFVVGGLLGVFGAVALEAVLLPSAPLQVLGVGLIEELAKLVGLAVVARRLARYTARDGVVLGAAVGFGFAALESSGYAFAALLTQQGLSVPDLVQTEVLRGLLAPLGHGLWTGVAGGVLFAAAGAAGRLRLTRAVAGAYLGVAVLHALWDAMGGLAVFLTLLLTATPAQRLAVETGRLARLQPTELQTALYYLLYWGGLAAVSAVGLLWLRRVWRHDDPTPASMQAHPQPHPQAA
ncbi:MAG TPA: PrsW family intramembrane metalloprotease [Candidatus Thermoplasmatota archaeon]|nr:PrsW family intramembrane metalloprotease [Candidatus Thermoplasmatota archaeon]